MVSVIIPNYNHARYLPERIESVLNQTYQDFEVIILDDCSTDNSREVIERYRNHPKVSHIVFNEKNSGSTFVQWQRGFNLAKGDYMWIAESDDVADIQFLEILMSEMENHKDSVVAFSSMYRIDENSVNKGVIPLRTMGKSPMDGKYFIRHNMLFSCHILNASSAIFKKESLSQIKNDFMAFKGSGDYLFWIEIANTGKVIKVEKPLDYFRNHSNKVTPRVVSEGIQFEEVHRILQRLKEMGFINYLNRTAIAGFWLRKIRKCKIFKTTEIRNRSKNIWLSETWNAKYAELFYLCYGFCRFLKKRISK